MSLTTVETAARNTSLNSGFIVFKNATWWRWSSLLATVTLIGLYFWFELKFLQPRWDSAGKLLIRGIYLSVLAVFIFGVIKIWINRVYLTSRELIYKTIWRTSSVQFDQIEFYQFLTNSYGLKTDLRLHMKSGVHPKVITIPNNNEGISEIVKVISPFAQDFDQVQAAIEVGDLLRDQSLGLVVEQREESVIRAHKTFNHIQLLALAIFLWGFLAPHFNYQFLMYTLVTFPLLPLGAMLYHKGAVYLDAGRESKVARSIIIFSLSSLIIAIRALLDFNIFDYSNFWKPFITCALIFGFLILKLSRPLQKRRISSLLWLVLISPAYSYGAVLTMNCLLSDTAYETYHAKVLEKSSYTSKRTVYNLNIDSWGSVSEPSRIEISEPLYREMEVGDTLEIHLHPGYLEIPWMSYFKAAGGS